MTFSPKNGEYTKYIPEFVSTMERLCGHSQPKGGYVYVKEYGSQGNHEHCHAIMWTKKPMNKAGIYTAFTKNCAIPKRVWNWKVLSAGIKKITSKQGWEDYIVKESNSEMETFSDAKPSDNAWAQDIEDYAAEATKRPALNRKNDLKSWTESETKKYFDRERISILSTEEAWPKLCEVRLGLHDALFASAMKQHCAERETNRDAEASRRRASRAKKRKAEESAKSDEPVTVTESLPYRSKDRCFTCKELGHWQIDCPYNIL